MIFKHILTHNRYRLQTYSMEEDIVILVSLEDESIEACLTINYFHANFEYVWMRNIFPNMLEAKF